LTKKRNDLQIGLSSWIVQDGNYPDFKSGGRYRFAVEFGPYNVSVEKTAPTSLACRHISGARYEVDAKIVVMTERFWVIDVGVLLFQDAVPHAEAAVGKGLRGEIYIGVDPFFYFERLQYERGMPNLFYEWRLNKILLETTPWIESRDSAGRTVLTRGDDKEAFIEVDETNAWEDDDGRAHYIFECELLDSSS